jgi:hypothetical protein
LDSQGTFKKKINQYWGEKTITLPNVKVGSILEYSYTLKSENIVKLPDFDIQYEIPVDYFEYKTNIPEYYIYKTILVGRQNVESDFKNPFNQENRQMAVYLGYPSLEKYNLNLEIPAGYVVESMPAPVRFSLEDKTISFTMNISNDGNKIQFSSLKEINSSIFAVENYQGLKDIFQKIITSQNQKIVLKKA